MMRLACAFAAMATTGTAHAQSVRNCDTPEANARNLVFPVSGSTRSFANGDIRFIALDTGGEPACCSAHLMVLLPSPEDPSDICYLISRAGQSGFLDISVDRATASYDATTGLAVTLPATEYGDKGQGIPLSLSVTVNQQTGTLRAETSAR